MQQGGVVITWIDPIDADYIGSRVMWRKPGAFFRQSDLIPKGQETANINGLINETLYEFKIISYDADGNYSETGTQTVQIDNGPQIFRLNKANDGTEADRASFEGDVSDNGRYFVFSSPSDRLDPHDENGKTDVFLYDSVTERLQLISKSILNGAANGYSRAPKISGDGRYIVFYSNATDLVDADTNGIIPDIFLYDRDADENGIYDEPEPGQTSMEIVSVSSDGEQGDQYSVDPEISADGSVIVFRSKANNLVTGMNSNTTDHIYVRHRFTGVTQLVDKMAGEAGNYDANQAGLSGNGRYVVFVSSSTNLGSDNGYDDVYLSDLETGMVERISQIPSVSDTGQASNPSVSADGRYVAFVYKNFEIDNGLNHIYIYDRMATNPDERVSMITIEANGDSDNPVLSNDGSILAFESRASNLTITDGNNASDIVVFDRNAAMFEIVSKSYDGEDSNSFSTNPQINGDGSVIMFASHATNLVSDDYNAIEDVFAVIVSEGSTVSQWPANKNVEVINSGQTFVTLRWTPANEGTAYYKILYGTESVTVNGDVNEVRIEDLTPDTTYTFKVEASNVNGVWSTDGPSVEATTLSATELAGLSLEYLGDKKVKLVWDAPLQNTDITGYEVHRRSGNGADQIIATIDGPDTLEYIDHETINQTAYTYRIYAVKTAGADPYTVEQSLTTPAIAIETVSIQTPLYYRAYAAIGGMLQVTLTGDSALEAEAVLIYRSSVDGTDQSLVIPLQITEDSSVYQGSGTIPEDASEILSVKGKLIDSYGHQTEKEALFTSVPVGGTYRITIQSVEGGTLDGSNLVLWSHDHSIRELIQVSDAGQYEMIGLPEGTDYELKLVSANGLELYHKTGISIEPGTTGELNMIPVYPASFSATIKDQEGQPVPYARVVITDGDGNFIATANTGDDGQFLRAVSNRLSGEKLLVKVFADPVKYIYTEVNGILNPFENHWNITVPRRDYGELKGTVWDENEIEVAGATVTVTTMIEGVSRTIKTVTDEQGQYSLEVPAGQVHVQAALSGVSGMVSSDVEEFTIQSHGQTTGHIHMKTGLPGKVVINIYTKYRDGQWEGPMAVDWRVAYHYNVKSSLPRISFTDALWIKSKPGDEVEVCVDGREAGLPGDCETVTMNEDNEAVIDFHLEEIGGKVSGTVHLPDGVEEQTYQVNLFRIDSNGQREWTSSQIYSDDHFQLSNLDAGSYQLEITAAEGRYIMVKEFNILAGENKNIGNLDFPDAIFSGKDGNSVTIQPMGVSVGGILRIKDEYRHDSNHAKVEDAVLMLEIPSGTEWIEGSLTLNSQTVVPETEGGYMLVPLGTLDGQSGSATYQLRVKPEYEGKQIGINSKIRFSINGETKEEPIGSAQAKVHQLRIDAPQVTTSPNISISGVAPAGHTVMIYDGSVLLGEIRSSDQGTWMLDVTLADTEDAEHVLYAEIKQGNLTLQSDKATVTLDPNQLQLIEVSMEQSGGRKQVVDPRKGVAKFPYVYVPGKPFKFILKFNNHDLVDQVWVYMGNKRVKAVREETQYSAILNPDEPAPIEVFYTEKSQEFDTDLSHLNDELPSLEELIPEDAEIQEKQIIPNSSGGGTMVLGMAQGSSNIKSSFSVEVVQNYVPTAADTAFATNSKLPVYDMSVGYSYDDKHMSGHLSAKIPLSFVQQYGDAAAIAVLTEALNIKLQEGYSDDERSIEPDIQNSIRFHAADFSDPPTMLKYSVDFMFTHDGLGSPMVKNFNAPWAGISGLFSSIDAINSNTARLEKLMDLVADNCDPEMARIYTDNILSLFKQVHIHEAAKWVMTIGSLALGPFTAGLGTVALAAGGILLGEALDYRLKKMIDDLEKEILNDSYCFPGSSVAEPTYIYDPSGYVYEVLTEARIEDVTATAMQWNDKTGQWDVWNADWYLQENPQTTDKEGRYGWDVPEGKWKVIYEKDGYITAESDELLVPPPHFDVNIPMVSTLPPELKDIRMDDSGNVIFTFNRPVKLSSINEWTLKIEAIDSENQEVSGTYSAVDSHNDQDQTVATQIRFEPATPLNTGENYRATISGAVESYYGVPMGDDTVMEFANTADTDSPNPVADVKAGWQDNNALLMWSDPGDMDLNGVRIRWKLEGKGDYGSAMEIDPGVEWAVIPDIGAEKDLEVSIRTVDLSGNESSEMLVWLPAQKEGLDEEPEENPEDPVPHKGSKGRKPNESHGEKVAITGQHQQFSVLEGMLTFILEEGSLEEGNVITVEKKDSPAAGENMELITEAFTIRTDTNQSFTKPVHVQVKYEQAALKGDDPRKLALYRLKEEGSDEWEYIAGKTDTARSLMIADIFQPGTYAVMIYHKTFADLENHWSKKDVELLASRHLIHGVGEYQFDPNRNITRAEMSKLLVDFVTQVKGEAVVTSGPATFEDVDVDAWYADAVSQAVQLGIVQGDGGRFRPNDPLKREEMAVMLFKALQINMGEQDNQENMLQTFSDEDMVSPWAVNAMNYAVQEGLLQGMGDASLQPKGTATRAQAAAVLLRLLNQWQYFEAK